MGKTIKIVKIVSFLCIAYLISFLFCNFNIIKSKSYGLIDINESNIEITKNENNTIISYKPEVDGQYINNIFFYYKLDSDSKWTINYNFHNLYGYSEKKSISGRASSVINVFEEEINAKIIDLNIEFDKNIEVENFKINNKIDFFSNYTIVFMFLAIDIILFVMFRNVIKEKIEYLFMILALSGGIVMILLTPYGVNSTWDDQIHYETIYGLANRYYTVSGLSLIDSESFPYWIANTETERQEFVKYLDEMDKVDTGIKTGRNFTIQKLTYLPSAIVFKVFDVLNLPFSLAFVFGKIIILLIYVVTVFFAIKITPKFKYLMLVIALIPVELSLASNYSYDSPIVAFILLGFAFYFKEITSKELISFKNVIPTIVSFIIASCAKAIYAPLLLVLLFLPKDKFKDKKQKYKFKVLIVLVFMVMMATFLIPMLTHEMTADTRGGDTDIYRQVKTIIGSPISFAKVAYKNVGLQFFDKFFSRDALYDLPYIGQHLSSIGYYLIIFSLFFALYIDDKKEIKINKPIIAIILVMIIGMIWGSMYLGFTPVGSTEIKGVQGRYFIPLLLPLLMIIYTPKIKCQISINNLNTIFTVILTIITYLEIYECMLGFKFM